MNIFFQDDKISAFTNSKKYIKPVKNLLEKKLFHKNYNFKNDIL